MHISENGIKLIENFEGFSSVQYRDSVGVPTIGYGTTSADISPLPTHCTRAQAEGWLRSHIARIYEPPVNGLHVPLNQNQYDALVSLCYNCGPGAMQWQIGVDLRARKYRAAADDFLRYVYAGGQVLQGLVNRRRGERALFLKPVPVDPLAVFWASPINIGGGKVLNERKLASQVRGALAQPKYHNYAKGVLRPHVKFARDRIWDYVHYDPKTRKPRPKAMVAKLWDYHRLGKRWQAWNNLLKKIDALK